MNTIENQPFIQLEEQSITSIDQIVVQQDQHQIFDPQDYKQKTDSAFLTYVDPKFQDVIQSTGGVMLTKYLFDYFPKVY